MALWRAGRSSAAGSRSTKNSYETPRALLEALESRSLLAAELAAGWGANSLGSFAVPGFRTTINPQIVNAGNATLTGNVTLRVYLSTDTTLDAGDRQVLERANLSISIPVNRFLNRRETLEVPLDLLPGNYYLLAEVVGAQGTPDSNAGNNVIAQNATLNNVWRFGNPPSLTNSVLKLRDGDGTVTTFSSRGLGYGEVLVNGNERNVVFIGTDARTTATIRSSGGDGLFNLNSITASNGTIGIGTFDATGVRLTGDFAIGTVGKLLAFGAAADGSSIDIAGGTAAIDLRLGTAGDTNVSSFVGLKTLDVNSWFGEFAAVNAPFIGSLVSRGAFNATVDLSSSSGGRAIGSIRISGDVSSPLWHTGFRVGAVTLGSTSAAAVFNFGGNVDSLTVTGNFAGTLAAVNIGKIKIGNAMLGKILAGTNFGADDVPGGAFADTFAAGKISSVEITGDMLGIIAAGINPNGGNYLTTDVTVVGGENSSIGSIVVKGTIGSGGRFMAGKQATNAKVTNVTVPTLRDLRFRPTDTAAPTISGTVLSAALAPYIFSVVYQDNQSVDTDSLDNLDIRVTGPNGFSQLAELLGGTISADGLRVTARYSIVPTGGVWTSAQNGDYTVELLAGQAKDFNGNFAAAATVGHFTIDVTQIAATTDTPTTQGTHGTIARESDGTIRAVFIENGQVKLRTIAPNGTQTVETIDAGSDSKRAVILRTSLAQTVIIAATDDQVNVYTLDGADWDKEDVFESPDGALPIQALTAALGPANQVHFAAFIGGSVDKPTTSSTVQIYYGNATDAFSSFSVSKIVDLTGLANVGTSEPVVRNFQVAIDSTNKAHLIFASAFEDAGTGATSLPRSILQYTTNASGSWEVPSVIQGLRSGRTSGDAGLGASIAINPTNGTPSVAALYLDRDNKGAVSKASVFYLRKTGSTWTSQLILSNSVLYRGDRNDRGSGPLPTLLFDGSGRANVAFASQAVVKVGTTVKSVVGQIVHAYLQGNNWLITPVALQTSTQTGAINGQLFDLGMSIKGNTIAFTGLVRYSVNGTTDGVQRIFATLPVQV